MAWEPDYLDVEETADLLKIDDDEDHAALLLAIPAASRAIDEECGRQFGKLDEPTAFYYTPWFDVNRGLWVVDIDDLMVTPTSVTVNGTTITASGYSLEPKNNVAKGKPWPRMVFTYAAEAQPCGEENEVAITAASWGWTAVPEPVRHACFLQVSRLHHRRDAPFGVAGSPSVGSEIRLLAKLDPDVINDLRHYVRTRMPR